MMGSALIWKMAWQNLRKQLRQTLLSVVGGSIGAVLITVSAVLYMSVDHSQERWLNQRFGPIEWELTAKGPDGAMTPELAAAVLDEMKERDPGIEGLPVLQAPASVLAVDASGQARGALPNALVVGLPWERGKRLDPGHPEMWSLTLGDDELVIDAASAATLGLRIGDAVKLRGESGEDKLFRVSYIAEESGLTGYRGGLAQYQATVLMSESAMRKWQGDESGVYDAILAGRPGRAPETPEPFPYLNPDAKYEPHNTKKFMSDRANMKDILYVFMAISGVAVLSGAVLMHQIMLMLGESRRELFGVLRAIGLSRRQISAIFMAESGLLSLLSTAFGIAVGVLAGGGLVYAFYGAFSDTLARMSGANIPIGVSVSPAGLAVVGGAILLFLIALAARVAHKLSRTPIVEALRGAMPDRERMSKGNRRATRLSTLLAVAIVAVHLGVAFGEGPEEVATSDVLTLLGTWLAACAAGLYLVLSAISHSDRWLSALLGRTGLSNASILLAVRYPKRKPGRTYAISLLFALLMMAASFTSIVFNMTLRINDVDQNDMTMYGFSAAVPYSTPESRERILALAGSDPDIAGAVQAKAAVEPYMALLTERGTAQSILAVTPELLDGGGLKLAERAQLFADDRQAWEAVMTDPKYIVLPLSYRDNSGQPTSVSGRNIAVKAGDTVKLPIYESKPRFAGETWVPIMEREFVVAGFAQPESHAGDAMDLYSATFVHPEVHKQWKPYGTRWPGQSKLGYVLLAFDYKNIELVHKLEERFAVNGVIGFTVPYADKGAEQFMNRQLFRSFVAFSLASGVIGLCGLAIVQFRSVRERGKQLAMMRCAGLSGRHLSQMFLLEGTTIGWAGLFTGWLIGATGAMGFVRMLLGADNPTGRAIEVQYPYEMLIPIIAVLLLAAALLNIGPARAALKLSPGAAIRASDE
jgi:putative ABC transport system permease protein